MFTDVDAKFSKISTMLNRLDAFTLPELLAAIEECTESIMKPVVVSCVYNIRDWLSPCLNDIHNQTFPHVYRYDTLLIPSRAG